jgi:hypothetical protein
MDFGQHIFGPNPIAMEPAATSAKPAVTTIWVTAIAPDNPAANAKGTVRPSDIPDRTVGL